MDAPVQGDADSSADEGTDDGTILVGPDQDAGSADAATDAGPLSACDADFIAVEGVTAAQTLWTGCRLPVPSLSVGLCGEDCPCSDVTGCSDASALDMLFSPTLGGCGAIQGPGLYTLRSASWTTGGASVPVVDGWIRFDTFTPPRTGAYGITLQADDGGVGETLGGAFCIQ